MVNSRALSTSFSFFLNRKPRSVDGMFHGQVTLLFFFPRKAKDKMQGVTSSMGKTMS